MQFHVYLRAKLGPKQTRGRHTGKNSGISSAIFYIILDQTLGPPWREKTKPFKLLDIIQKGCKSAAFDVAMEDMLTSSHIEQGNQMISTT